MRDEILSLLSGQKIDKIPTFSGLIHITVEGLAAEGLSLSEAHHDSRKMARAAASTFRLTGMPSAALPLDLCAPAEALGSTLNYYEQSSTQFPQPAKPLFTSTKYLSQAYFQSADFLKEGRLPLISEAIRLLKREIGDEVVLSGVIPGPYTMLLYLIEPGCLFTEMKREPHAVLDALFQLSSFLSQVGSCYRDAGADWITIHEMGGSPGFIGPTKFEQFTFPAVSRLIEKLPKPVVLSVCGNTNKSMHLLAQTGGTRRFSGFKKPSAEKPDDAEIQNNLAVAYEAVGETARAHAAYRRALELAPEETHIRRNYARFAKYYTASQRAGSGAEAPTPTPTPRP